MLISFVAIVILLIILTFVWPPDSPWSPWWRTNKKVARAACRLAKVSKNDIVYELGSGDGEFVIAAAYEFKAKKVFGIEIDYSRYFIANSKKKMFGIKNAKFIRGDFKKINLSDATVVYFYLVPAVIKRIMPKLRKELKPGTRIVSYKYELPIRFPKKDNDNKLFLYTL